MNRFQRLSHDLSCRILDPGGILMRYYSNEPNVGDLLNPYMVTQHTGRRVHKALTHRFRHLMGIGSILEGAGPRSVIWGSGSINGTGPRRPITAGQIHALRGKRTLALMQEICGVSLDVPLGDPGLLMPIFHDPEVETDMRVGIVPHHSEKDIARRIAEAMPRDHLVIDVALDPEAFIRQMRRCRVILSSSLHGLILADAYGIANKWISLSNRLEGGDWKFKDYYSVTSTPGETPYRGDTAATLMADLEAVMQEAGVSRFAGSTQDLLAAFPAAFRS
ncbi:polysaccharide pyruvyl transferase family protein [Roseovarius tibetensis]|uniref:polysaccharide pyruvyl transferase family protein n=1 Tax=Roseovarius tibetensis TaxID=2685897 RepID=UPI003D7FE8F7